MIYIYLLAFFALLPIFAYLLSQKTKNKGSILGISLIIILSCLFIFVGKFSFLGSLRNQELNTDIQSYIAKNNDIPIDLFIKFEDYIENKDKIFWIQSYIGSALSNNKLQSAESLISLSEKFFKSTEEKFIFYSLYTDLRNAKFPVFKDAKIIIEFEDIKDCSNPSGDIQFFIMNGPGIAIASSEFSNFSSLTLTNSSSSIPGFDIASAYLNKETIDIKALLNCTNLASNLFFETSILFDQALPLNTYKIKVNEWFKKEQ
tara:strand:+ start:1326 stop:2105 length:780 start_codon:yes stop_codon:yes gene_type:complete